MRSSRSGLLPCWLGMGLLAASLLSVSAQPLTIRSKANSASIPSLRAESQLVLINATVVDSKDRLIQDLQADNFRVFEDKREQQLAAFALEDAPVSLGIVFDASGSMKKALPEARTAVERLLDNLRPDDEMFLVTFRSRAELASDFGADPGSVRATLAQVEAKGGTALLDALVLALHHMKKARRSRRALVVFSDGDERNSRNGWEDVLRVVREADVRIYPVVLTRWLEVGGSAADLLTNFARKSGGRYFRLRRWREFSEAIDKLEIHTQYVLGYVPTNRTHDGKYRRVTLKLNGAPEKSRAYWRRGYFAPE